MQPPFDVRLQRPRNILVDELQVEPLRVKVASTPARHMRVLLVFAVKQRLKEFLIPPCPSHVLRRSRPRTLDARRDLRRRFKRDVLL